MFLTITNIYVLDNNNSYKNIRDYLNLNAQNIDEIFTNYATNNFVKDYSMPRLFNDVYFIGSSGYQDSVPTSPSSGIQFSRTTSSIGDFELFSLVKETEFDYELASKNGYSNNIFVSASADVTAQFRLTTECKVGDGDWQYLNVELSNDIPFINGNVQKVIFNSPFTYLGEKVINLTNGDKIRQTLEVVTQESTQTTFNVYSNEVYSSIFYLTSQSYTSSGGGGGGTTNYNELQNKPALNTNNSTSQIPDSNETLVGSINLHKMSKTGALADAIQDATHRTVTDTEKETWNNKSDFNGSFNSLTNVPTATTSTAGIIELATDVEASNGTDQTKAINSKQLKTAIDGLGSVFVLKGSVPTASSLPTTGNQIGDVWYVVDESVGYIWLNDGTTNKWEQLGLPIDLSTYIQFSDVVNVLTSTASDKPLSAYQGKVLYDYFVNLNSMVLKRPSTTPFETEIVGVNTSNNQIGITAGDGISLANDSISVVNRAKTDASNLTSANVESWKNKLGYENIETVYDKTSNNSSLNWGYTSGITADTVVSGKDFSKYKKLIVYYSFASNGSFVEIDLTYQVKSDTYKCSNVLDFGYESSSTNYLYVISGEVNGAKTSFKPYLALKFVTTGQVIKRDEYNVYKIEGVY